MALYLPIVPLKTRSGLETRTQNLPATAPSGLDGVTCHVNEGVMASKEGGYDSRRGWRGKMRAARGRVCAI